MNQTTLLRDLGQSLWLDNITRELLDNGTLRRYIDEYSITGPDLQPDDLRRGDRQAATPTTRASAARRARARRAKRCSSSWRSKTCAARPTCSARRSMPPDGVDGWVSMELSPLLATDTAGSIEAAATRLHAQADRPNLFVKIPGTPAGVPAIEESIFAGVPINVTLLFSREQYVAAAEAYLRGIERRIAAGLDPRSHRSRRCSSAAGTRR